ncbi:hypothetical protein M8C21_033027, partial [Ambrosia artemisiifolia]
MVHQGSLSFSGKKMDIEVSSSAKTFENALPDPNFIGPESPLPEPLMNRHLAALKLQKTYKSFRTRRQLADCAILVEHRWWKLLDFAVLKCSSVSFFEIEKPETAVSRWSRARTRAAKVGKFSSQHAKACKLALQHWLEAIDPRHRYGHNLHFYYVKWLHCESRQPFFYWLDIGEGKEVSLDKCPRPKLLHQCIKYLSPKHKGKFQHSSFLAGGATLSAGQLVVIDGILKVVWPHSGHYLPTEENFDAFMSFLEQHQIDVQAIKKSPDEEDEVGNEKVFGYEMRNCVSDPDISSATEETGPRCNNRRDRPPRLSKSLKPTVTTLEIPKREDIILAFQKKQPEPMPEPEPDSSSENDDEAAEELWSSIQLMASKKNLFDFGEEACADSIPKEKIMQRINSHKETKSFQLAKHLSCRWSTGAGPRIGCVRDYPSELQFRALEEVSLPPKHSPWRLAYSMKD